MGWKMVYNSLDKNRENREKMLLTFAKNSIRSKPPPSFRAVYHNKNHVITNTGNMFDPLETEIQKPGKENTYLSLLSDCLLSAVFDGSEKGRSGSRSIQ